MALTAAGLAGVAVGLGVADGLAVADGVAVGVGVVSGAERGSTRWRPTVSSQSGWWRSANLARTAARRRPRQRAGRRLPRSAKPARASGAASPFVPVPQVPPTRFVQTGDNLPNILVTTNHRSAMWLISGRSLRRAVSANQAPGAADHSPQPSASAASSSSDARPSSTALRPKGEATRRSAQVVDHQSRSSALGVAPGRSGRGDRAEPGLHRPGAQPAARVGLAAVAARDLRGRAPASGSAADGRGTRSWPSSRRLVRRRSPPGYTPGASPATPPPGR